MDVTIRGQNIKITDSITEFTHEKLDRLDRYLPRIAEIRVDLSRQSTRRGEGLTIAQITLRHSRGAILRAEEKMPGEDRDAVRAAINQAVDKLYRQIERFKGKRVDGRKTRSRFAATAEELDLAEQTPSGDHYADYVDEAGELVEEEIVRRKDVPVMAMTEDEAIEQMELLGHSFFMFLNGDTGSINVLYRRTDGGYGLLVPAPQ